MAKPIQIKVNEALTESIEDVNSQAQGLPNMMPLAFVAVAQKDTRTTVHVRDGNGGKFRFSLRDARAHYGDAKAERARDTLALNAALAEHGDAIAALVTAKLAPAAKSA
jgi:hypothetical protein